MSNKTKSKLAAERRKLKGDGKAIAALEQAVHKGKEKNAFERAPRSRLNNTPALESVVGLLGDREEQEAAWIMAFLNPEAYAARIPITQVTGAVPVNLYRKTLYGHPTCNASNFACVATFAEGWHKAVGGAADYKYLRAGADAATTPCTYTINSFVGTTAPTPAVGLPVGGQATSLGDVDTDFTSDANDGTEYIMVGCMLSLRCLSTPTGAADEHYVGRVMVARTLDPERYDLMATTETTAKGWADEEDAQVQVAEYMITPEGGFRLVTASGTSTEVLMELNATTIPMSPEAYNWERITGASQVSAAATVPHADLMFYITGAPSQQFEARWTGLWQTERYPSHLVQRERHNGLSYGEVAAVSSYANALHHNGSMAANFINNHGHYHGSDKRRRPLQLARVDSYLSQTERPKVVMEPHPNPSMPPVRTVVPATAHKRRKLKDTKALQGTPDSVGHVLGHTGARLGLPVHPGVAPMAVLSSVAQRPGMWNQIANAGAGALRTFVAPELAKLAARHGPQALEKAGKGFTLSKFLSGAWDVAKVVGPAILSLLA